MNIDLGLPVVLSVVFSLSAAAAPMPRLGGGGNRLADCRQADFDRKRLCPMPSEADIYIEPHALYGGAIESSGCSEADRSMLLSHLESAAAHFNSGVRWSHKGVGGQIFAQVYSVGDTAGCREATAEWRGYIAAQRELFMAYLQNGVRAGLAQCPSSEGPAPGASRAPKKRGAAARRVALCREGPIEGPNRLPGACRAVPAFDRSRDSLAEDITHADMRSCPQAVSARMHANVSSRAANFKMSLAFYNLAGLHFLAAQGGVSCDETFAAAESHAENQTRIFSSVWMAATAKTAETCRSVGAQ